LKRIKVEELAEKREEMEELSKEVRIYRELKHPNIVKFYESFVEEGYLYIVMEVIKGCNLSELIRNQNEKAELFE
jgi:serine/threonine protein kinase